LPVCWRHRGGWVIKSYELVTQAFRTPTLFSSNRYGDFSALLGRDWPMLTLEVDPPLHQVYRGFLNKVVSPSRMNELKAGVRETVDVLIGHVLGTGGCEFQSSFGRPLPTAVFLRLMGLPLDHASLFLAWEATLLHAIDTADRAKAARAIKDYLVDVIAERGRTPRNDVVSSPPARSTGAR
jgi:cytochrome P450